jgi:hypothetical protein
MSEPLYHFECPVCEYDDAELGRCLPWGDHYCGLCWADNRRAVRLRLTRIQETEMGPSA